MMLNKTIPALLALEDGTLFHGISVGVDGQTVGEVVFNTAMSGYQEILTDPSYARQIVTLTYPHIGNTGTNDEDAESEQVWVAGLIVRDIPPRASNWRMQQSLPDYLHAHKTVAIADIDTRRLTRILREKGAQNGCIVAGKNIDENAAIAAARGFAGLKGMDLAKEVSVKKAYAWTEGTWRLPFSLEGSIQSPLQEHFDLNIPSPGAVLRGERVRVRECFKKEGDSGLACAVRGNDLHLVVYDFGVKRNILRYLIDQGCKLTVVPAQTPAAEVLAMQPDGVVLSNGPGDPSACDYAIEATKIFLEKNMPVLGICLGHQLLGLACGAKTIKMKFGHHGANHPVQDLNTHKIMISSQNHGFAVDEKTLPQNVKATHRSLFDGSLQGIAHTEKLAFSFQGHPEGSPGPHDVEGVFADFVAQVQSRKKNKFTTEAQSHKNTEDNKKIKHIF